MDTLFVIRDSIVACVRKNDLSQSSINTGWTGISWQEVATLAIILLFVITIFWLLCKYQIIPRKKVENKENGKNINDDGKKEQLAELKDRLYNQLQSSVYIEKVDANGCKIKEYSKENDETYIRQLCSDIEKLEVTPPNNDITKLEGKNPNDAIKN